MPKRRAIFFGLFAVALGLTGAYLNFRYLENQQIYGAAPASAAQIETVKVAIAKADLPAGVAVNALHVDLVDWPRELIPHGAIHTAEEVDGRSPRRVVMTGEPILLSSLINANAGAGLSPIIADGMRAISVKVDDVVGVAGFVKPGTHVDVLATIRSRAQKTATFSKVILQDIKVLAIDQNLEKDDGADPKLVNVVTLEVSPKAAQKLTFAAHEGKIQLAMRNPADAGAVNISSVTASNLRGVVRKKAAPRARVEKVEVIKGLDVSTKSY